jgi:hypothetical protein
MKYAGMRLLFLSNALQQHPVGLEEVDLPV